MKNKIYLCGLIISLVAMSCTTISPDSRTIEMQKSLEAFLFISQKAYLAGDISELSQVATGTELQKYIKATENRNESALISRDINIEQFYVSQYNDRQALIKCVLHFRNYHYELSTKQKSFMSETWSTATIDMVKEGNIWKVAKIELGEYM